MLNVCAAISASGSSPVSSSQYILLRNEFNISAFSISVSATYFSIVGLLQVINICFWYSLALYIPPEECFLGLFGII